MRNAPATPARRSIRRHVLLSSLAVIVLVGGIGGLAVGTELAGAVIASGTIIVDGHIKKVQHLTGGLVGEIHVKDGDSVKAGQVVIRLDDTVARANLAIVSKNLDELSARVSRLEAERDGRDSVTFDPNLVGRSAEPDLSRAIRGELRMFESRRTAREGQKAQLSERIHQLNEQIDGLVLQAEAKADEIVLIGEELVGVEQLWRKNLVAIQRVVALRREKTRIRGERGQLLSGIAQARGRISETELQIIQIDQDLRSEVAKDLRDAQAKIGELQERNIAARDQLERIEIRAPQDGIVHELSVHTIGGVVEQADTLMQIVPDSAILSVEVRVSPQDIDQLLLGQDTVLRLTAFNQRTTPELMGDVTFIAADAVTDPRSGVQFYPVRIAIREDAEGLGTLKLVPGMPVDSFIQTKQRTVLSYLTKPLADYVVQAFRHD